MWNAGPLSGWQKLAIGIAGMYGLVGCGGEAAVGVGVAPTPLVGELVTYVADYNDGHSERRFYLQHEGRKVPLHFAAAPAAKSGDVVEVTGDEGTDGVVVAGYRVTPRLTVQSARRAAQSLSVAFVIVDTGLGSNIDAAKARQVMFGAAPADRSFQQFYNESSFGRANVHGDVFGPVSYPLTTCNDSDMDNLAAAVSSKVPETANYDHVVFYLGQQLGPCNWGGLGVEGSADHPAKNTWINGYTGCSVLMQEFGHNIGLMHANTLDCNGHSFDDAPDAHCSSKEYGSRLSPMGSGCHQLNVFERWYEGWIGGCQAVRVPATGTFNLVPLEGNCAGVHTLQIPMPRTRSVQSSQSTSSTMIDHYYLELRTTRGLFDDGMAPSVMVYATSDVMPAGRPSVWSWQLDMNPATSDFDGLGAGKSFTDPAGGVTIHVDALDKESATVTVTVAGGSGAATCSDGTSFAGPGPRECVDGTGPVDPPVGNSDGGSEGGTPPGGDADMATSSGTQPADELVGCALAPGAGGGGSGLVLLALLFLGAGALGRPGVRGRRG